jgi:signal transduction histidine kinase
MQRMPQTINVLLIEDNPGDMRLIQHMLTNLAHSGAAPHYILTWRDRLAPGLQWVAENPVDVVLLDLSLPDSQGMATVQRMQAAAPAVPLIVLTGLDDETFAVLSLQAGIQDYLVKDHVDEHLLRRAIRYALERQQMTETLRQLNNVLEERVRERTAQLERAVLELERASQLKDEFLATISHEMRTPLTGVLGMAEALEQQLAGELNERQLRYVTTIRTSGSRLLALVNSILRYTNLISGKVELRQEPCRVESICANILRLIRPLAEQKQLRFTVGAAPELELVTDVDGVCQLLCNLLDNAVKFTPAGGQIGLDVRLDDTANRLLFTIWDTGIGMSPEQQEQIFKPFMQVDASLARRYEGIGLGLAYTQRMVELLHGELTLTSTLGQGSRFTVSLPLAPEAADGAAAHGARYAPGRLRG